MVLPSGHSVWMLNYCYISAYVGYSWSMLIG